MPLSANDNSSANSSGQFPGQSFGASFDNFKYSIPTRARVPSGQNVGLFDRIASASLGAVLLGGALRKRDPGTSPSISSAISSGFWPSVAVSLPLFYRAITGHSFLYASLGLTTAGLSKQSSTKNYDQQMSSNPPINPFDVQRSVTISRPRPDVFRFVRDFNERQALGPEFKRLVREDNRIDVWASDLPHEPAVHLRFDIIDAQEDESILWRCTSAAGREEANGVITFSDAPGNRGTEVTVALRRNKRGPRYFGTYFRPYLGGTTSSALLDEVDRIVRKQLRQVKQTLEVGQVATAEQRPKSPSTYRQPPPILGRRANPLYGGAVHHTH